MKESRSPFSDKMTETLGPSAIAGGPHFGRDFDSSFFRSHSRDAATNNSDDGRNSSIREPYNSQSAPYSSFTAKWANEGERDLWRFSSSFLVIAVMIG